MKLSFTLLANFKYFLEKLSFLKVYNSPFKPPKVKFYFGEVSYGVPYFYPRRWVNLTKKEAIEKALSKNFPVHFSKKKIEKIFDADVKYYMKSKKAIPKIIGFDFVGLGWKTKWEETDYRFEWNPIWSFVFFKWQICLLFEVVAPDSYWTSWLYYTRNTDKNKSSQKRIEVCKKDFPQIYISHSKEGKKRIDYYPLILK